MKTFNFPYIGVEIKILPLKSAEAKRILSLKQGSKELVGKEAVVKNGNLYIATNKYLI